MEKIMTFPLLKEEENYIKKLKYRIKEGKLDISREEKAKRKSIFEQIEMNKVAIPCDSLEGYGYVFICEYDAFLEWVRCENKKAKKIQSRDVRVAIIGAIAGVLGSTIVNILFNWIGGLIK